MNQTGRTALSWTLGISGLLLTLFTCSLVFRTHFSIWPLAKSWKIFSFADENAGGKSRVLSLHEEMGVLRSSFQYGPVMPIRYGGIEVTAAP
jgi:hypothetical protein